ncbi:hypothetical protein HPOKI673_01215 [Helicobacter pylori oki673]|nr:hypothetical protein HPOKI673_01215 [Helicobacter pylori oki673]
MKFKLNLKNNYHFFLVIMADTIKIKTKVIQ